MEEGFEVLETRGNYLQTADGGDDFGLTFHEDSQHQQNGNLDPRFPGFFAVSGFLGTWKPSNPETGLSNKYLYTKKL